MSFAEAATPPQFRRQVIALQQEAWPTEGAAARQIDALTHDPELRPASVLLVEDGTVLAALDILSQQIAHAGRHFLAGGLSAVVTRREMRGQGLGRQLVAAAREMMAAGPLDLGLFTCDRPLRAFYESAGWQSLPGAVLIGGTRQSPFPSDQPGFDKVTMADFFSAEGRRHRLAFEQARIELYPGEIDRLW
ncbi:GNAT family N-acetyltransferase [Streptomyces sp. NPDC054933]